MQSYFFSTVFSVFYTPYHLFSTPISGPNFSLHPPQFFSTYPGLFYPNLSLYIHPVPLHTPCAVTYTLRRYIHPFGLYERSLQVKATTCPCQPPACPPARHHTPTLPHPAPPCPPPHPPSGPTAYMPPHSTRPATPLASLHPASPL